MTTQLSPYLLSPDIDLTSEETQWRDVELWYRQVCFDEFQFTDRLKFFCVKWLLENRKRPHFIDYSEGDIYRWHWTSIGSPKERRIRDHARVFTIDFADWMSEVSNKESYHRDYCKGHDTFGDSILWFCSLWPRFYVECVLPIQENEPANAEEFWENLNLCFPGEDWREIIRPVHLDHIQRWGYEFAVHGYPMGSMSVQYDKADLNPQYRWSYGNAILRAVKAWRGETE